MKDLDQRLKNMKTESNNKLQREVHRTISMFKGSLLDSSAGVNSFPVNEQACTNKLQS